MAKKNLLVDLDFNQNEVQNVVIQNLASAPATPKEGQQYWNTADKKWYIYDGTNWVDATNQGEVLTFSSPLVKTGTNVTINTSSNTGLGAIRIATDAEVTAGTSELLAVNPKQLATKVTANAAITAGTATKITYDSKGLVTAGTSLSASDIPDISATYVPQTAVGAASGVASLDSSGKVPASQLPSFVDDVVDAYIVSGATALSAGWLSATSGGAALTPETDKIYVIVEPGSAYENKTYRWSGSTYVEISAAPGQATESTAGIAAIATQAEVTTGTNDTKFITPLKFATALSGNAFKETATNGALTASGGVCTWTISTTKAPGCVVAVYETTGGAEVMCDITHGSGSLTIKINSTSNISAGVYTAVIIG